MNTSWLTVMVSAVALVGGCGTSPSPGGSSDGGAVDGDSRDCPAAVPQAGSACGVEGLTCNYGTLGATCNRGAWSVVAVSAVDECSAAGGKCSCAGGDMAGFATAPHACPQPPPGSGACGAACFVPVPGGCGGSTCTLNEMCCTSCGATFHRCIELGQGCDSRVCPADAGLIGDASRD